MARPLGTSVTPTDLMHTSEYLIRLAYAPVRSETASKERVSIKGERLTLLAVAATIEKLNDPFEFTGDYCEAVEKCCIDLQGVIKKTLSPDAVKRMRTAIRRMRMTEKQTEQDAFTMISRYERHKQAEADQQDLKL